MITKQTFSPPKSQNPIAEAPESQLSILYVVQLSTP